MAIPEREPDIMPFAIFLVCLVALLVFGVLVHEIRERNRAEWEDAPSAMEKGR